MRWGDFVLYKISIDWFEFEVAVEDDVVVELVVIAVVLVVVVVVFVDVVVVVVGQIIGGTTVAVVEMGNSSPKYINFHYQLIPIIYVK